MTKLARDLDGTANELNALASDIRKSLSVVPTKPSTADPSQAQGQEDIAKNVESVVRPVTLQVSPSEAEHIDLTVTAEQNAYRWGLEITYESDGKLHTATVDDKSFFFTSLAQAQAFALDEGQLIRLDEPVGAASPLCGF